MVTSIIYNIFLKRMLNKGIDLTARNTYKMCLLKRSYKVDEGGPSESDSDYYHIIAQAGYECVDRNEISSYKEGGQYVQLEPKDENFTDNTQNYYLRNRLVWDNVTFTGANAVMYVLLYREPDGFPIAIYKLDEPLEIEGDSFILDWGKTPIITIDTIEFEKLRVDPYMSLKSINPLENRAITDAFGKFGVAFTDEMHKTEFGTSAEDRIIPSAIYDDMTRVSTIKEKYITSLFEGLN